MLKKTLIILFIILASRATITSAEEVIDSICAIVDEEIILESEVTYGVHTLLLESGDRYPTTEKLAELRNHVLDAYITQKILFTKALEDTITVESRIVDRELTRKLESLIKQIGSKEKLEEYFGRPLRQIKREMRKGVRDGLLIEKLKQLHLTNIYARQNEVIEFYRKHADDLPKLPESVELSHILIGVIPSEDTRTKAEDQINYIFTLLQQGADFDSVAREFSDDPSASDGGRLGFTERNDLVPEYEEVAYQLEEGAISGIVETRYGLHLIRVIERQGERISTQHILIQLTPTDENRQQSIEQAREIKKRIDDGEDFAEMALRYSIDTETAAKGGQLKQMALENLPGEFREAIETIDEGEISDPFETSFGVHIVKLNKRLSPRAVSLKDDWQIIEQFALAKKRETVFLEWVEKLRKEHYIWQKDFDL